MKQKSRNIWEAIIVFTTIVVFTISNSLHVLLEWRKNKPEQVFHAIAHSYPDYFIYLSHIAQGATGKLFFTDHQFTNETLAPTSIYWFYSVLGFIGNMFHLPPPWIYNLSLLFLSAMVMLLWYLFCRLLYPTNRMYRLLTFLVIVSASPFINIEKLLSRGLVEFPQYLWFSPAPAFNRLGGVPHQILQTILLLMVLIGFSKMLSVKRYTPKTIGSLFLLMTLSLIATSSHPLQMALLLVSIGAFEMLTMWREKYIDIKRLIPVVACGVVSLPVSILINHEFTTPIYTVAKQWEMLQYSPTGLFFWVSAIGPIIILVPFGIWPFIKKSDPLRTIYLIYGMLCFALYNSPIPKIMEIVPQRFLHPASYALLPILAVSGFFAILHALSKMGKRQKIFRFLYPSFFILTIIIYLAYTMPANIAQITLRINDPNITLAAFLNHTPIDVIKGLTAIKTIKPNTKLNVIMPEESLGIDLLIPLHTGYKSFLGQSTHTLYPDVKNTLRRQFFSETMTEKEALQFLTNHSIGIIITTPNSPLLKHYPFLTKTFSNNSLTIYTVSHQ